MSDALETERLILRPPGRQDLHHFVPLIGNYEVARNLSRAPHPYTEEDGRKFLLMAARGWVTGDLRIFAILPKNSRISIGMCGVNPSEGWETGYWIGKPYWGLGYATEAVGRLVHYAFDEGAERLNARWFHDNPASGRVLEKLGFMAAGETSGESLARGRLVSAHRVTLDRAAGAMRKLAA